MQLDLSNPEMARMVKVATANADVPGRYDDRSRCLQIVTRDQNSTLDSIRLNYRQKGLPIRRVERCLYWLERKGFIEMLRDGSIILTGAYYKLLKEMPCQ